MKFTVTLFFSLVFLKVIAQHHFSGYIKIQSSNETIAGAFVLLPDLRISTATNEQGYFSIQNIPKSTVLIEISVVGYSSIIETINIDSLVNNTFYLSPTYIENKAVIVTGVSSSISSKFTPVPIAIIKKDDLFNIVATNLIDALSHTPGVSQISTGPSISKPEIRGLGYNRLVTINDGIRQEGQQWGDEHGLEIDEYNVNRIEIVKGPSSIMYGSDAMAGVINILSIQPVLQNTIKVNLLLNYQTNNHLSGMHADVGGNNRGFLWGAYFSNKNASDYSNKFDGFVFNSKFNEQDLGIYFGLQKKWGFTHLYFSNFHQHLGLIEGNRDSLTGKFLKSINENGIEKNVIASSNDFSSTSPFNPNQNIIHQKLVSDNQFNFSKNKLTLTLGLQRNQRQEFGNVILPLQKTLWFNLQTFNFQTQFSFHELNHWKTNVGVSGMLQNNMNKGQETLIPEYSMVDAGLYFITQKKINQFNISGGIRLDFRHLETRQLLDSGKIKFNALNKKFSNLSASIGLSYALTNNSTFKFNVAKGFRAPNVSELSSNGAHEGSNRYEYGMQNLTSENSYQIDAAYEFETKHIAIAVNLFYNHIQHFIFYKKLLSQNGNDSLITVENKNYSAFQFVQNNASLYGFELIADFHPHPLDWLHFENSISYVRGILQNSLEGINNLPFIPAPKINTEIRFDLLKKNKLFQKIFFSTNIENTLLQNRAFTAFHTETETPAYTLVNASIGATLIKKQTGNINFNLSAINLFNVAYQSHLSRLKYLPENDLTKNTGVYNMGRNYSIKIIVPITYKTKSI